MGSDVESLTQCILSETRSMVLFLVKDVAGSKCIPPPVCRVYTYIVYTFDISPPVHSASEVGQIDVVKSFDDISQDN